MRISDPDSKLKERPQSLHEDVERLRKTLGHGIGPWSDLMGVTEADYRKAILTKKEFSVLSIARLAERFELTLDAFMTGNIDFKGVAARNSGQGDYLPERYSFMPRSKKRSSINALDYVEEFMGWEARAAALRHLQVSEKIFEDPEGVISLSFLGDLCAFLKTRGATENDLYSLGAYSVVSYSKSPVGKLVSRARTVHEVYEILAGEIWPRFVEKNFTYRIHQLKGSRCVVDSDLSEELVDAHRTSRVGGVDYCMTRAGVTASLPGYLGLPFGVAIETHCVHRGDSRCRYEVDLDRPIFRASAG